MWALAAAVIPFAVSTSVSPGPNNVMLAASGANFGFARTLPHMLGVALGFPLLLVAVGLGLGGVFAAVPALHLVLKVAGAAYLLYLAWRIASADGKAGPAERPARPLSFWQAAAFQWANAKAWIMALGAATTYTTPQGDAVAEIVVIAAVFGLVSVPTVALWAGLGVGIGRVLERSPRALRAFNVAMGLLLALSVVQVF
ncbi:LysE family translocator [Methylobacterium isbiliense]|jgi:threonine/homoserine/homoserine lactone efflux protein|uniref:Cysteine/O-acetylserine efflux protein n=1 Tax=Methylobacterium isbiliense TaxID=315478 RepID=A0ABQ4SKM2_9HYPH|nr:LysE family translocator [Methylobacterium isbiliense]MDN3626371.1 LysE family translocator [Methylobacterium isbiliense]GJE03040.1 Cysteine/O-acetylserine efflux protein [Methylobacterium isbiliense]